MNTSEIEKKQKKISPSLYDEIEAAEQKVRKLKEKLKLMQSREKEKNKKFVFELICNEHLDIVPLKKWEESIEAIKSLLNTKIASTDKKPELKIEKKSDTNEVTVE